jgi:hypothetical protein
MKFVRKFDFNPGSVVVGCFPFVPGLFTWTEKVLGLSSFTTWCEYVVLSGHFGKCM